MASRSDQLHSHQFVLQRVVGALAMRDPDPASSPLRRIGGALFASVMVAALALAAVGVYGVLRPGPSDSWRTGNALIIEEETGARFVYRDGVLHPVLNYPSALLILGAAAPPRARVPRASLVGVTRGGALGIAGAPDLLPGVNELLNLGWTLCSRQATSAGTEAAVESVLLVGATPSGTGAKLGVRGLIARDSNGGLHLLWNNRRYAITDPDLVLAAFAWPRQAIVPAATALLNAVPAGADLGRMRVERSDKDSPVPGFRVGQVFVVSNQSGGRQFGVARPTGLAEITSVQADLLVADAANGLGGKPKDMGQAQYAAAPKAASLVPTGDAAPPALTPEPMAIGAPGSASPAAPCASFGAGGTPPELTVVSPAPRTGDERRSVRSTADLASPADWIAVPPGRGVLVEALAGPGSPTGALALVTDLGVRYPVPSREVLGTLGYGGVTPLRLPAALVALLPSGRALDPAAAVTVVN
jgi:type VII secretion protein EccB